MNKALKTFPKILFILGSFVLVFVLGCCDSTSSSNSTGNTSSGDKVVLEFWNTMDGREAAIMPEVFKAFNKKH